MAKLTLDEQAQEIIRIAEECGVQSNFFFLTTFNRYAVQLKILKDLEASMKNDGVLVTKEYVKGRQNVYSHQAVADYTRTTDSANKTVATLMKILKNFGAEEGKEQDDDPILSMINGGEDDEDD